MAVGKITKAIITAAGRGTRFLPVSKAFQKEMVPVMHKPQLQWVIEEAIESGITDIAVVTRKGIDTFQKYLDHNKDLWKHLKENGEEHLLNSWVSLKKEAKITLFEQKDSDAYGNGTPFIIARKFVKDEPFAAMWGDDIMIHIDKNKPTCLRQMMNYYDMYEPAAVMATMKVPETEISRNGSYGYYEAREAQAPYHAKVLVEKPEQQNAPSLFANACRFILTPKVIEELSKKVKGKGGEIWLTDAVNRLIQKGEMVLAPPWEGSTWVPVGDPVRWLKANLIVALTNEEFSSDTKEVLKELRDSGIIKRK